MQNIQNSVEENLEDTDIPKHDLPSFPDSLNEKGFSQAAIKDAVSNEPAFPEMPEEEYLPPTLDKSFKTMEMEEWSPSIQRPASSISPLPTPIKSKAIISPVLKEPPATSSILPEMQKAAKNKDIFVKLDKFYSARKSLTEAQQKLEDIDELIRKIRETKLREEQELEGWEKELMNIKSHLNDLNINLFEKVD